MSYKVVILDKVSKQIESFDKAVQKRIGRCIDQLAENPRCPGYRKVESKDYLYRIHAGRDHVVLYQIEDKIVTVLVVRAADRKNVYRKLPNRISFEDIEDLSDSDDLPDPQ